MSRPGPSGDGRQADPAARRRVEDRSLIRAMCGNLFMAALGLLAGLLSNSSAIMLDGLFSLVGFVSAILGRRVGRMAEAGPDRHRPFGYAADEAIFATFRSLSLLGLILFAVASAGRNILAHVAGAAPEPLHFAPMMAYFVAVGLTCALLWTSHRLAWIRSGRQSGILRLEARAALFDGVITTAAGLGLGLVYLLRDGVLAPVAPIGDSLIVLLLCLTAVGVYLQEFRSGLRELAGASAPASYLALARRALRPLVRADGGALRDLSITKLGRTFLVTVYYDPLRPVAAAEIDDLNLRMIGRARSVLPGADVLLLVTEHPRRWPEGLAPG